MKTIDRRTSQVGRRHPKKLLTVLLELLYVAAFFLGVFYLWSHKAIPPEVKTSVLTIIGGVVVLVVGQMVQKGYLEPFQEMQKTIGEISSALLVYGNTCDHQVNDELKQEASRAFRKLSGDLIGKRRVILHYRIFERLELLPSKGGIAEVAKNLIFLSNSVGCDEYAHFDNAAERIKAVLWLDV